jgi:hypothetical protein
LDLNAVPWRGAENIFDFQAQIPGAAPFIFRNFVFCKGFYYTKLKGETLCAK